jgi:N-6 DNA methylase
LGGALNADPLTPILHQATAREGPNMTERLDAGEPQSNNVSEQAARSTLALNPLVGVRGKDLMDSAAILLTTTAYDPICGSGSLLLKVAAEAGKHITLEGQEKDVTTAGLARMNMILHDFPTANILTGNTLAAPKFKGSRWPDYGGWPRPATVIRFSSPASLPRFCPCRRDGAYHASRGAGTLWRRSQAGARLHSFTGRQAPRCPASCLNKHSTCRRYRLET